MEAFRSSPVFFSALKPGPAAGRRRGAALTLLRFRKARVLPCRPAPLLLAAGLPALPAAPGGAQAGQALLLQAPPAGAQRGCAGRRAACSYALLRNSFSGKWGSFAQQRPLALSSVRSASATVQRCRATVRRQDALAYLRALPCQDCTYADPPYIFPGRSMNYYGTKGGGTKTHSACVAVPIALLAAGFFGQNRKLGAKSEFRVEEFRPRFKTEAGSASSWGDTDRGTP